MKKRRDRFDSLSSPSAKHYRLCAAIASGTSSPYMSTLAERRNSMYYSKQAKSVHLPTSMMPMPSTTCAGLATRSPSAAAVTVVHTRASELHIGTATDISVAVQQQQ
jgi:hypothetical protein